MQNLKKKKYGYLNNAMPAYPKEIHTSFNNWSSTKTMMFVALMAALAAILQSAGGFLPGIGYFFSPFATLPILFGVLISFRSGILSYFLTIGLLFLIEPSELLIFPFTTGLLGLGLGWTFRAFKRRLGVLFTNGLLLFIGICTPLYAFNFPVFGPAASSTFNLTVLIGIFGFSLLYSFLWLELGLFFLRKVKRIM